MKILLLFILAPIITIGQKPHKIFKAIEKGNLKKVETFLAEEGIYNQQILLDWQDAEGYEEVVEYNFPVFSYAIMEEKWEIADRMIKDSSKFSDWKASITNGYLQSISSGNMEQIRKLEKLGVDYSTHCIPCWNQNALQIAIAYDLCGYALELTEKVSTKHLNSNGISLLNGLGYAKCYNKELVEVAVRDCELNQQNNYGYTPIMSAAESGNLKLFNRLLSIGEVDLETKTKEGASLLQVAIIGENMEIIKQIIDKADINHSDYDNWNAFNYALETENSDLIKMVVERGASINHFIDYDMHFKRNVISGDASTLLQIIDWVSSPSLLQFLIDKGLKDTDPGNYGWKSESLYQIAKRRKHGSEMLELIKSIPYGE